MDSLTFVFVKNTWLLTECCNFESTAEAWRDAVSNELPIRVGWRVYHCFLSRLQLPPPNCARIRCLSRMSILSVSSGKWSNFVAEWLKTEHGVTDLYQSWRCWSGYRSFCHRHKTHMDV